jgi:HlyD family type I secretion membrane fusion protein
MAQDIRNWSARFPLALGFVSIFLLVGSLGAWSVGTQIAGAVVAPGVLEVESERQVIQHPDGGVVGEILARDGDKVEAGDVLVRLDGTFLRSELAIVEGQLLELFARKARLEAEQHEAGTLEFDAPPTFMTVSAEEVEEQIDGQRSLFEARRSSLAQNVQQLREQQDQVASQIEGILAQQTALSRQLELIEQELADTQTLFDKGLVQAPRLLALQREEARLHGEIGNLTAATAEARTRIAGLEIQRLTLYDQRREEAITRLRDLSYSEIELKERRLNIVERLARLDIRAPVSGTVFGSKVASVQSVVQAAEPMMYLVPGDQPLQVSARISPIQIDRVYTGQDVALMFTTFNRRTTPEVPAKVIRISPDAAMDEATGETFYEAVILPDEAALREIAHLQLLPGMPVEAYLKTQERSPLSYMTQPLTVYFQRAFREE